MIVFYTIILSCFTFYSFALVDPNLTLINHSLWAQFRENLVYFGYYQRGLSWNAYLILLISLFICPFLSHDFFNYMFDARIATFYHQNPYLHKALDYPADQWLRFMHWTHRTYPYGPVWLLITIIPSFLSFGKFIVGFILFKVLFIIFYIASVFYLNKLDKKWAIFFATNPLVLIEGLINTHNDFIAASFAIIGIFYMSTKKEHMPLFLGTFINTEKKSYYFGLLHLFFSAGIKYLTLPLLLLQPIGSKLNKRGMLKQLDLNLIAFIGASLILIYLSVAFEIQPWYFLTLFAFLPFYEKIISNLNIFFAGLLFSYYPYIRFGGWDKASNIELKHWIIIIFFLLNLVILVFPYVKKIRRYNQR